MKCPVEFHVHPVEGALREALAPRTVPPLPGYLMHLINFPHFVHVSRREPRLWAYTPTLDHLAQDRQIRTTPGKILRALTKLPDHQIRDLVEEYTLWVAKNHPQHELLWAKTPWEVQEVYENRAPTEMESALGEFKEEGEPLQDTCAEGSSHASCMGYDENEFRGDFHPARVYGGSPDGSIAVAYLKDGRGILARVVCSMHAKTYVRLYQRAYSDGAVHLRALLEAQGFTPARHLEGTVKATWYDEDILHMPYLDWETTFDVEDGKVYFGRHKEFSCSETEGIIELELDRVTCSCCGARYRSSDDLTYVEWDSQEVCDDCLDENYVYAYTGRYQECVPNDEAEECDDDGEYYTEAGRERHGIVQDDDGNWRKREYVTFIETLDEYVDNDDVFQDGALEDRAYKEITADWYLHEGVFYESDPELEGQIQLGTLLYAKLWSRKPDFWTGTLQDLLALHGVEDYQPAQTLAGKMRSDVMRYERAGNASGLAVDVETWERRALQYGITFDEGYNRAIVFNQLDLLAA